MASTINNLKAALGQPARSSKYRIILGFPSAIGSVSESMKNVDLFCKSATFPGKTLGQIELWNQGRKLIIPGDTSYANTWNLTFYQSENHDLRNDFVLWMKACDDFQENWHSGAPNSVLAEMRVIQLDSKAKDVAIYTFHNVFPQDVADVGVGDDLIDQVEEFDVTFSFTDWVVGTAEIDNPGDHISSTKNPLSYS